MSMNNKLVVMGVSGSGKSTFGKKLAERLGYQFVDADDYHSAENKQKMASGVALTDEDRKPWLLSLASILTSSSKSGTVLACSSLKKAYRDILRGGDDNPNGVTFVYLKGNKKTLASRLAGRSDHFFNEDLLDSQLATLEEPQNALVLSIENDITTNLSIAIEQL